MAWRNAQALHIYVPPEDPFSDNWVEQVLGSIVRPIIEQFRTDITWIWITRYSGVYEEHKPPPPYDRGNPPPPGGHIPLRYRSDGRYRFVLFRLSTTDSVRQDLHDQTLLLARQVGCHVDPPGWLSYDVVGDLGGNRFIRARADLEEQAQRARLIVGFISATVELMLDSLAQNEQGQWVLEPNADSKENPHGSPFESVHHLFCNATGVPTTVNLAIQGNELRIATSWMTPLSVNFDPEQTTAGEIRIQY